MDWMIDGRINLNDACRRADWHLASVIDNLMDAGLNRDDAESFASYAFAEEGHGDGETHLNDLLTDDQHARMALAQEA